MYNNGTPQYPPGPGYNSSYPTYQYGMNYGYPGYGYQTQQAVNSGETYQVDGWNQGQDGYSSGYQPPPPSQEPKVEVVQEMQQQKATLTKQREDYVKKAFVLRRELEELKNQKQELASDDESEKELRYVLKENERLQDEIISKLKAIVNVIEMLSSIIKDGKKISDLEVELQQKDHHLKDKIVSSSEITKETISRRSRSPSRSERDDNKDNEKHRCNYVYYDTGLHWCRSCDKFPDTAKEFLQHLHSPHHQERAKENEVDTTPWHKLPVEPVLPSYEDAPKKRIPIKGLQFFISAPSWYCKLCDVWIGDLHCASHHLKSQAHFQNFENFVKQNPHWETEWLKDRDKAMSRKEKTGNGESSSADKNKKKKRRKRPSSNENILKEKKKKKRSKKKKKDSSDSSSSSSSSSDSSSEDEKDAKKDNSDKGKSIRVAMRNMHNVKSIMDEDMSKWSILGKLMQEVRKKESDKKIISQPKEAEDELINQWMTVSNPVPEKEKNLLESLKDRMKAKHDLEKAKLMELEMRRRAKEREDEEKKRKQVLENAEKNEREKKRKEEEMNKILDKDRGHVKFRASRGDRGHKNSSRDRSPPHRSQRRSSERSHKNSSPDCRGDHEDYKKKPPGPPSYKKLPFIGRMPLFKNKKFDHKVKEEKEIKVEEYEPTRRTRFESGNLTRAFIPRPDVVCYPVLSSIPPIAAPPEPTKVEEVAPPIQIKQKKPPKPPSAPLITAELVAPPPPPPPAPVINDDDDDGLREYRHQIMDDQPNYQSSMDEYYEIYQAGGYDTAPPHPPLEPPPLPPDDDLAMLGICADDMAAQTF